jgi:hypothetical protein
MRKMSKDTRRCNHCNTSYDKGFYGTGYKYCSTLCRKKKHLADQNKRYQRFRKLTIRPCLLCGRDIGSVRVRKNVNKYCSTRCMFLGRRYRKGQKYCYVRIPVTVQKLVRIPIRDLPLILKRGVPKPVGK